MMILAEENQTPLAIMPKVPITMPQLGESMAEATIVAIKVSQARKSRLIRKSSKSKPTKP